MTLKQFLAVNNSPKTRYSIWDKDGNFIEDFRVDYIGQSVTVLGTKIDLRDYYAAHRKTKIKYVMVAACDGFLDVDVIVSD